MTREHLYKAKRKDWRELPKEEWWVEGYLYQNLVKAFIIFPHTGKARNGLFKTDVNTAFSAYVREVEPDTVCEYTQMTDKNNSKIFDGDIVRRTDLHNTKEPSIGFIEYDTENTSFLIHWTDVQNYSATFPWKDKIEVIDNVFDNPKLLEGGDTE